MDGIELVRHAVELFGVGDIDGFVACFAEDACVYAEPHVSSEPLACGHAELRDRCARLRREWGEVTLSVRDLREVGEGLIGDVLVMAPTDAGHGGWRFAAAFRLEDDLIAEVRPYWQVEAASAELLQTGD